MKPNLVIALCASLLSNPSLATTGGTPPIEQSIYKAAPPFDKVKLSIYVRERERPLLPLIEDASTSIAQFLLDVYAFDAGKASGMPHVPPAARGRLRLPPLASLVDSTGRHKRFVDDRIYCWQSDSADQLRFLIEWADITTMARYTDSYVFVRNGSLWLFEGHDTVAPWYWTQTRRYFQRSCPPGPIDDR